MLIFPIWLSLWFGQLCSRGHGTKCQGVQFNEKWKKIPMAIGQCGTPRVLTYVLWTVLWSFFLITITCYCWHNFGTVWLILYYWTSKLINALLSPSFPNSHHLRGNFPNYKGPDPRYKWVEKSLTSNKHVGFKALCTKRVWFKALVISKSFSSLLIGCVRRPTPRTDKGSSSIIDNDYF